MYIKSIEIKHLRSITSFKMEFENPAGWHVLIGDNGAGKSSIVRGIAIGLIGPRDAQALRLPLINWIQKGQEQASVALKILKGGNFDKYKGQKRNLIRSFDATIKITKETTSGLDIGQIDRNGKAGIDPYDYIWSNKGGWFSTSFGPFRRFTGGDKEWSKVYYSNPSAAAHLSIFGEDVALTESLEWLLQMKFKSFEQNSEAIQILEGLKKFINEGDLLPHKTQLVDVSSSGVFFKDGNGNDIDVTQLSDGFRSLLSLIFELIRQLVKTYGEETVFANIKKGTINIDVSGVVLIDEIDAHLHPTWQTRIGQWFTTYFPNIQFIVTTHSPLVCRACDKGTIWRLGTPGGSIESSEITGIEKDKLIYGNILDAYSTEIFGQSPVRSDKTDEKAARLGRLNMMSAFGNITAEEEKERQQLQQILATHA